MPGYSTLSRSSSQTPSTHPHDSIRRRPGVHQSSTSLRKVLTGSPQTVGYHPQDITQRVGSEAAYPSAHTTASSSSNPPHFTAISSRSHHSPPIPSCTSRHRPLIRPAYPTVMNTDDSSLIISLNPNDGGAASFGPLATPTANISRLSQISANIQLLAKKVSSMAHSGLVSIRRRALSLPKPPPTFNSIEPPSPKSRLGLLGAYKLTQKWPRPRSLRSVPPGLRADLCSPHRLCELEGAGGWGHDNMKAALRDSQGLGGRYTSGACL
ncbi:hypothetical protein BJV78DRAFT_1238383 [Lactifluus subvellereus]|nr:hypothetical protein BJV78DRAFT_1238383 [Lactifluus subvellereus]